MPEMYPGASIMKINLSTMDIERQTLSSEDYRLYLGGSSLACYLIMNNGIDPKIDPLSPESIIVFSVSPVTGLPVAGTSRMNVTAKSPLTNFIGDSQSGGFFPAQLRFNGWDAIMIKGKAAHPVYLFIDNNTVELRDASSLWGMTTLETEHAIKDICSEEDCEIIEIGPAGENLVRYACILSRASRANGRTGMGAVMGSKLLKAIVCKKQKPILPYDKENFTKTFGSQNKRIKNSGWAMAYKEHGTNSGLEAINDMGFLPTRNWTSGYFPEGAQKITGSTITETVLSGRGNCFGCAINCKRKVSIPEKDVIPAYGGPEYETAAIFGSCCGVSDLNDICLANQLCNMYGIDTITAGATIALAMECYEAKEIDNNFTGNLSLKFGNSSIFPEILEQISYRSTPLGDLLAEGSYRFAEKIGKDCLERCVTVKKQELPAHAPLFKPAFAIHYSVNPFGPDHCSAGHDNVLQLPANSISRKHLKAMGIWKGYEPNDTTLDSERVRYVYITQCFSALMDSLELCQFPWGIEGMIYNWDDVPTLLKYGIGYHSSLYDLMLCGERRIIMMKYFNYLAGHKPENDDCLPDRVLGPMQDGPSKGLKIDKQELKEGIDFYHELLGCDKRSGKPSDATLQKLSLLWLKGKYENSGNENEDNSKQ